MHRWARSTIDTPEREARNYAGNAGNRKPPDGPITVLGNLCLALEAAERAATDQKEMP